MKDLVQKESEFVISEHILEEFLNEDIEKLKEELKDTEPRRVALYKLTISLIE